MADFVVDEPFVLPTKDMATGAKHLDEKAAKKLLAENDEFNARGCYVITARGPNRGHTPIYVGKAAKRSLAKECLISRNTVFINETINEKQKRTPCLFLVRQVKKNGKWNESQIGQVEEYLIANAASKNPNLKNKQHMPQERWRIRGVINARKGESTIASKALKAALNIS